MALEVCSDINCYYLKNHGKNCIGAINIFFCVVYNFRQRLIDLYVCNLICKLRD